MEIQMVKDQIQPVPKKKSPHTFTREECIKGAVVMSPFKALAKSLSQRKRCSTGCQFFEHCPVNAVSLGYIDPVTQVKSPCLMKSFPPTVKQQFINMFLTGEEGIIHHIKTMLHHYLVDVEAYGNLRDKRDSVQLMLQFYDKIYNNQKKGAIKKEPLTITIRRVGMEPQTMEIMPRGQLPEGVTMKDITNPLNEDPTEGDPESLLNSPMIQEIISGKPTVFMEEIKIETNFNQFVEEE